MDGQFSITGTTTESSANQSPFKGTITVESDGSLRGSSGDGPITEGELDAAHTHLTFEVLYNASMLFRYELQREGGGESGSELFAGLWALVDSPNAELEHNHGSAELTVSRVFSGEEVAHNRLVADRSALPLEAGEGNEACKVSHVNSVAVPCAMCDAHGPDARLAFFGT